MLDTCAWFVVLLQMRDTCARCLHRPAPQVVFLYAVAGADVRAAAAKRGHPVPLRSLVAFDRVSVGKGGAAKVRFAIAPSALALTDESGALRVYKGAYTFVATRGHGAQSVFHTTLA